MEALKAYNTETINRLHKRKFQNTDIVDKPQADQPELLDPESGSSDLPEPDLVISEDCVLDFVYKIPANHPSSDPYM